MCGIVAVLRGSRRSQSFAPTELLEVLDQGLSQLGVAETSSGEVYSFEASALTSATLQPASDLLSKVNKALLSRAAQAALVRDGELEAAIEARLDRLEGWLAQAGSWLEETSSSLDASTLEDVAGGLRRLADLSWALRQDRLGAALSIRDLAAGAEEDGVLDGLGAVEQVFSALNRLEVRGRDSAGVVVLVAEHGLDLSEPRVVEELASRNDPLLRSGSVRSNGQVLGFFYKTAAEIGELGDNVAVLRNGVRADALLRQALRSGGRVVVLGHTRWASVGMINEANAHPLDDLAAEADESIGQFAALNGDVDNWAVLVEALGLRISPDITTDRQGDSYGLEPPPERARGA